MFKSFFKSVQDAVAARILASSFSYRILRIGELTVIWAYVEGTLDLINSCLGLIEPPNEPFPISLKQKLRFFRAAFRQPEFQMLKHEADLLADETMRLSKSRHDLIHGTLRNDGIGGNMNFVRHVYAKGAAWALPSRLTVTFAPGDLERLCAEAAALQMKLGSLNEAVQRALEAHLDDLRSQLAVAESRAVASRVVEGDE
jgi:hypothetical protein